MRRSLALLLALGVVGGCAEEAPPAFEPAVAFDTATAWIRTGADSTSLLVEVARTEAQHSYGLMARPSLDPNSGMIFLYDSVQADTTQGFWMFRTRIPLDIAFADSTGRIVAIRQMVPCEAQLAAGCPSYEPWHAFRYALEVSSGLLSRRGIAVGARLRSSAIPGAR